jgi:hypothetical protein
MSGFRQKAMDAIRAAVATDRPDRKAQLLTVAQAWLELAEHERRVREVEVAKPKDIRGDEHAPLEDAQRQGTAHLS